MSKNSFWQNLPEQLSQPTSVAIITSVGLHAVVLGALPIIAWSDAQENTQRLVSLIDLPPSSQSQVLQTPPIPSLSSLADSSAVTPGEEVPLAELPAPPPITTNFDSSSNPFKFPNLPPVDRASGSVTLPPLTLPDLPPLPEPPPLELPSSVVSLPPQPPSLAQESVPPRVANLPQSLPAPTSPPNFRVTRNPNPGNTLREIPNLSQFSDPPQIPPEFQATYPPDAVPVPPPPTTQNNPTPVTPPPAQSPIAVAPGDTASETPSPAEQLRGIEASIDSPPSVSGRSIPEIPPEFAASGEALIPDETEATASPSAVAANPASPPLASPTEPVFSQQRAELVAELQQRRQMLVEDPSNTTPTEANRNWLTWVEAVQDVDPQNKSLTTGYPKDACLKKLEGTAVYGVLVNPDGAIADTELIKSSGYGVFNQKAREAINQHNFGSFAEPTPIQVTVNFDYDADTCPSLTVADLDSDSEQGVNPPPAPTPEVSASPVPSPPTPVEVSEPNPAVAPAPQPQPDVAPSPTAAPAPPQAPVEAEVEVVPPAEIANPSGTPAPAQPASTPQPEPPQSPVEIEVVPPAEVMMPADSPEFYRGE